MPLLDPLREAGLTEHAESDFIASATREGREGLSVVAAAALRTGNARMWSTVLSLAREPSADLSPGMLVAALGSSKPEIRAVVYWYLALTHRKDGALRPELEAIIARTPETASPDSANVDAAFALVVLRRAQQGLKFGGDWGARAASGAPVIPVAPRYDPAAVARLLTKAEASALSRRLTDGRDDKVFEREAKKTDEKPGKIEGEEYGGVSFAGGLPPGTLRDILAVTGCQPAADVRAMGFVGYRSDGRPRKVSVSDLPVSRACAEAAGPALGLTLAPPGLVDAARPDRRTVVIIPMNEEALACADEPEPTAAERLPEEEEGAPPGKIQAPRKVKSVAPWYPERAKAARRQGIVILKAVITQSGCIRSVRVIRGVSPELDVSAMIAVGQWRYTPTLLRGKPVPVIMTVTVNFHLN